MRKTLQLLFALFLYFVVAQDPNFDPTKSTLYGPGTQGSQAANGMLLYVRAVDASGNNAPCMNPAYFVNLRFKLVYTVDSSQTQEVTAESCTDSVYLATYVGPQKIGTWTLTAGWLYANNTLTQFSGSPVNVTASAGNINPPSCVAYPPTTATAGENVVFNITTYDKYGNVNETCFTDNWLIQLSGSGNVYDGSILNCTKGVYYALFNAQATARYTLRVTVFSQNIKNSPFPVVVNPGALDPQSCTVAGDIFEATAGVKARLQITARDKFGNSINTCDPSPFSDWQINFGTSTNITGSFDGCTNGVYSASYIAFVAKSYVYSLTYKGANIAKSPYTTEVSANSNPSPATSYPSGTGMTQAVAGITKQYQINIFDAYGNPIHLCLGSDAAWSFSMVLVEDPKVQCTSQPQFSNCFPDDAYFTVLYTCERAGNYTLTNSYNNQIIKNGQFVVGVIPGGVAPQQCVANGTGLSTARAGVPTTFTVESFDQYNNKISLCDPAPYTSWKATLSLGGSSILATVTGCKNGVYNYEYTLNQTGRWTLIITYNGLTVDQPFYTVVVVPGPPAPGGCIATGAGLVGTVAGVSAPFGVTCADNFGNPINDCTYFDRTLWNALFTLRGSSYNFSGTWQSCTSGASSLAPATSNFTYVTTTAGSYNLIVYYSNIMTTPTYNPIVHAGEFDPAHSYAQGAGVESQSLIAGDLAVFQIIAADRYGNKLDTCSMSASDITFDMSPAPLNGVNVTGCSVGVTNAQYVPIRAGPVTLNILYKGTSISGNPYKPFVIAAAIDAGSTLAYGAALLNGIAGQRGEITIKANDRFGNLAACVDPANFAISLTLNAKTVQGVVENCTNGIYYGYYVVYVADVWYQIITYQGTKIQNGPWNTTIVAGPIDPKTCVANPGYLTLAAGVSGNFSITCDDSYNNTIRTCGAAFTFTNSSVTRVVDCQNGVYTTSSSSTTAGTYIQTITYNQQPIRNQVVITVNPGPISPQQSTLVADTTYPVGAISYFVINARDQYQNPIYDCGLSFDTSIVGKTVNVTTSKDKCEGAKFIYQFNVTLMGGYQIFALYQGVGISNSPAPFTAVAGPIYPALSKLSVTPYNITAGTAGTFLVVGYDVFGNLINTCTNYSSWVITMVEEPLNKNAAVQQCSNGQYTGLFTPYIAGVEHLRVTIDGQDVGGQGNTAEYRVLAGLPAANGSIARPVDGTVGETTTWDIEARDAYGNTVTSCAGPGFQVLVRNDKSPCQGTSDCASGIYKGHYVCQNAGIFDVIVTLNSQNVTVIPPQVKVVAGAPYDPNSYAVGPGVTPNPSIVAGTTTSFVIVGLDIFKNQASRCPDYAYNITFSSNPVIVGSIVQVCTAPGNTTVTYTALKAGTYQITIFGNSSVIGGGPYSVNIVAGPLSPSHITNGSVIYETGSVGQIFVVPLILRDQYNNTIVGCSASDVGNFTVRFNLYDGWVICSNNQYIAYYQANATGTYTLIVSYQNQNADFSPYPNIQIIYGEVDFSKSFARGPGVSAVRTPAGTWDSFSVYFVNKYGYLINYCDDAKKYQWDVKIASPSVIAEYVYCGSDFGYYFRFNATVATKYKVDISINGTVIANNSNYYALIVPGPIYPPYTHVDVPYNSSTVPYDGYFYIIAEDRYHNPIQNLDGLFDALLAPHCANTSVHCTVNNTQKEVNCTYTVAYGGIYCIDILYNESEYLFFASYPELSATQIVHTGINLNIIGGSACADGCNNQGVCTKPNVCSCWTNRTGDACEYSHSSKYMKLGLAIGLIIGLAIAFFIIGILIGYCLFKYLNRGGSSDTPLLH